MAWPAHDQNALIAENATRHVNYQFDANLQGYLAEEHNADGTHADVTVESLSILSATGNQSGVGILTDIPFAPSIYSASGSMVWTVALANQITLCYELVDNKMTILFYINNTNISGTPSGFVQLALPLGLKPTRFAANGCLVRDKGTTVAGQVFVASAGPFANVIAVGRADSGGFSATASNDTGVFGQIVYPVG